MGQIKKKPLNIAARVLSTGRIKFTFFFILVSIRGRCYLAYAPRSYWTAWVSTCVFIGECECVSVGEKGSLDTLHGRVSVSSKTLGYILLAPLKPAPYLRRWSSSLTHSPPSWNTPFNDGNGRKEKNDVCHWLLEHAAPLIQASRLERRLKNPILL